METSNEVRFHLRRLGILSCNKVGLQEIKNAYRKMALKYHPDKSRHVDASQHFCEIYASYNWLICNYASDTETSCSNSHQKQDTGFKTEKGRKDSKGAHQSEKNMMKEIMFHHRLLIQMLMKMIQKGVEFLQTSFWQDISDIFNIDVSIVQQYGVFVQQCLGVPINFTIYLMENEVKKKFIHRSVMVYCNGKTVRIDIFYSTQTEAIVIIPSCKDEDVVEITEKITVLVVDPEELS